MPQLKMKKNAHSRTFIQFVTQKSCGLKKAFLGTDKGTSIPHSVLWVFPLISSKMRYYCAAPGCLVFTVEFMRNAVTFLGSDMDVCFILLDSLWNILVGF